jgi:GNAT superfamily N-acetyltransferase
MRFAKIDPSALHGRAFCLSSVRLWCGSDSTSVQEVAGSVEGVNELAALTLGLTATRGNRTHLWFPHIEVASPDEPSLSLLIQEMRLQFEPVPVELKAFAELHTIVVPLLSKTGWRHERNFPVQIVWPDLTAGSINGGSLPDNITIDINPSLDEVAQLFALAFIREWEWYFAEMGYDPKSAVAEYELHDLTRHFVSGADVYFVARIEGLPAALSSLVLDTGSCRAEFHTGVGVTQAGRGRGLGRLLTNFTLDWARRQGMTSAEVRTQEQLGVRNHNIKMYKSCGGVRERTFGMFSKDFP